MSIDTTQFDAFNDALVKFGSETTDPKAALVPSYLSIFGQVNVDTLRYIVLFLMHLSMLIAQRNSFAILRRTGTSSRTFRQFPRSQFHQLRLTHSFLLITRASGTYQAVSQSKVCIVYLVSSILPIQHISLEDTITMFRSPASHRPFSKQLSMSTRCVILSLIGKRFNSCFRLSRKASTVIRTLSLAIPCSRSFLRCSRTVLLRRIHPTAM